MIPFPKSSHIYIVLYHISYALETYLQTVQVAEGSDGGQNRDVDDVTTDSDGPVETHVRSLP